METAGIDSLRHALRCIENGWLSCELREMAEKEIESAIDQLKQKEEAIENLNKLLAKHGLKIEALESGELQGGE